MFRTRQAVFCLPIYLLLLGIEYPVSSAMAQVTVPEVPESATPAVAVPEVATAKTPIPAKPELEVTELELPDIRDLSATLADHSSRQDALLTLVALAHLIQNKPAMEPGQQGELVQSFRESRSWLDRLADRYEQLPSRSTVLDPAVLVLQQELWQHRILPPPLVAALGPDYDDLLPLLFDRDELLISASFLPEVLFRLEHSATRLWLEIADTAKNNAVLGNVLMQISADWLEPWTAAEAPTRAFEQDNPANLDEHYASLQTVLDSLILPQAPDQLRVKRLLFDLHRALPSMPEENVLSAERLLRLVLAVDGLHDGNYLAFSQSLLWISADLMDDRIRRDGTELRMPGMLASFLPRLSNSMARSFAEVDARINANLAAVFDVMQELKSGGPLEQKMEGMQQELGDAIAQQVLLAPDLGFYFQQPVRRQIREEIDICISLAADRDDDDRPKLSREQFDSCMGEMVDFADSLLTTAELSGDLDGPFALDQLARELELLPAQRINYLLGYLYEQAPTACPAITQPLPNPLDWAGLVAFMSWFAMQAPVFMQTPENEVRIRRMQEIGSDLMRVLSRQLDCLAGAAKGASDPVSQVLGDYRAALEGLVGGIREAEIDFREMHLKPGADAVLSGDVGQNTAYRTEGLTIGPCNLETSCEMTQPLEATRALIGLFPDAYLLADQTGMGTIEICYDNTVWVNRRAVLVRPEDPHVANFFGQLSFDLKGRFHEGEISRDIFGATFVSPEEYNYLIGEATDEVLEDECPVEWVGQRIVTKRNEEEGFQIVPNRLTYLAASRSRASELMNDNWSKGDEWRDRFVTGQEVTPIAFEADKGMSDRLGQHLRSLYQAEQQAMYGGMLRSSVTAEDEDFRMLNHLMNRVTTYKALLRAQLIVFYPESMLDSDAIRGMLEGQGGLLDETIIRRFRANNSAISEIRQAGLARLDRFQALWKQQPEAMLRSGSVPVSLAHAMARLNYVDDYYFTQRPANIATNEAVQTVEPTPSTVPGESSEAEAVPEGN